MIELNLPAPRSLSTKLMLAALLSLLCAAAAYLAVFGIGTVFVDRYYMSPNSVAARKAEIYTDFNRFVQTGGVGSGDAEALQRYLSTRDHVGVAVYSAEALDLPGGLPEGEGRSVALQSYEAPRRSGISGRLYPMKFSDGVNYITITDNSREREDTLNRAMGVVVGILVTISMLFWYTNRLTWRIIRLSQEAATVGAGDLNGPITVDGVDEVATLAADIDGMRDAIIERMGNEKRAWEANSELITAMSHDIRTPMTSLIGYLGLLSSDSLTEEERKRYLEAAYGKSLALKELTDELFKYFLVFGRSELELHREDFDIHMLLMQLLGEAEFDLRDSDFNVQSIDRLEDGWLLNTDAAMLKRVIDNVVSNVKKYADRSRPVIFLTEHKNNRISVTISNGVANRGSGTESTKIGLRTCEKILEALGGSFVTARDENHFAVEFSLPMK